LLKAIGEEKVPGGGGRQDRANVERGKVPSVNGVAISIRKGGNKSLFKKGKGDSEEASIRSQETLFAVNRVYQTGGEGINREGERSILPDGGGGGDGKISRKRRTSISALA